MEETIKRKRGRKPVLDKKKTVTIYPRISRIETLGMDQILDVAHSAIEKEYFKKLKRV